jgi:hypothetical protein
MLALCTQVMPTPSDQPATREASRDLGMTPLGSARLPNIQFLGYTGFPISYKMNVVKHDP